MAVARVAALLAALLLPGGCAPSETPPRLVLLYAPCSVSSEYLAPYAADVPYTPHVAAFAQNAMVFTRHQTEAGTSGIAYASIFSGVQAPEHGVYAHPARLPDELLLMTEAYAAAGWNVVTWLHQTMATADLNYAQGATRTVGHRLHADDPVFLSILDELATTPDTRVLMVTNFSVTHRPYPGHLVPAFCERYPAECGARRDRAAFDRYRRLFHDHAVTLAYDFDRTVGRLGLAPAEQADLAAVVELLYKADVYRLDRMFGRVVEEIAHRDLLDESLIVFTADHGEVLHRKGTFFHWSHAYQLAPEVLAVPLLVHTPKAGIRAGRYERVTRSIDLLPTLAALSGVPLPAYAGGGTDLSRAMAAKAKRPAQLAFSHSAVLPPAVTSRLGELGALRALFPRSDPELMWVSLRDEDTVYKLRRLDGTGLVPSVYDLARDPAELEDLYDPAAPDQQEMIARLERYRVTLIAAYQRPGGDRAGIPAAAEKLRSLGYIQ